jgi:hypothetical protein
MTNVAKQDPWPEGFSERFHIFALGEQFDVDAFLAASPLIPDFVWRQQGNGPTNGFDILLGDGKATMLTQQEEMAAAYLAANRDALRELATFPGVEALNLGLVVHLGPAAIGCCVGPPDKLMFQALNAGVSPVYYITLQDHRSNEAKGPTSRL